MPRKTASTNQSAKKRLPRIITCTACGYVGRFAQKSCPGCARMRWIAERPQREEYARMMGIPFDEKSEDSTTTTAIAQPDGREEAAR
jgi:hypothetical protein